MQPPGVVASATSSKSLGGGGSRGGGGVTFAEDPSTSRHSLDPGAVAHKKSRESQRALKLEAAQALHPGTTLTSDQWEMIEDDLLPFEVMAILISLGAFTLIGISIHVFTTGEIAFVGTAFLNGLGYGAGWTLLLSIPALVGIVQVVLAVLFSGAAALEKWEHASIQDVIRHHLPTKIEHYAEAVPLNCTAKGAYVVLMVIFILGQIIAASIAIVVNDTIESKADSGDSGQGLSDGLITDVLGYTAVVYNECCFAQGWSKQGEVLGCDVPDALNCTVPPQYKSLANKLCACHPFGTNRMPSMRKYVNSTGLCRALRNTFMPISNQDRIPGTTLSIRNLISRGVYSVPVVGSDTEEFGCGVGYFRGFQWVVANWVTVTFRPYFTALLIVSCVQLVFLGLGYVFVCRVRHKVFKYDEEGNVIAVNPNEMNPTPRLGLRGVVDQIKAGTFSPAKLLFSPRVRARTRSGSSPGGDKTLAAVDPLRLAGSPLTPIGQAVNNPLASPSIGGGAPQVQQQHAPYPNAHEPPRHMLSGEMMLEATKPSSAAAPHRHPESHHPQMTSPEQMTEAARPTPHNIDSLL